MPEEPILKIWHHRLWNDFGSGEVEGHLILHPQMFSLGTSGRSYTNCTTTMLSGYAPVVDAAPLDGFPEFLLAKPWDVTRAKGKEYEYLMGPRKPGTVHVATRGKGLAIAVGHHCATIGFGLEGHLVKLPIEDYKTMVSEDSIPGPSTSKSRAEKMRSFRLLDKYKHLGSRNSEDDRCLNVLVSVVCADFAYIIVDFARLVKFHIFSRREQWTARDLQPGSEAWDSIWLGEKYGPDWNFELDQAIAGAHAWKVKILAGGTSSSASRQAIVEAISSNSWVWNGYGKHTACDVVHLAAIHPFMPVRKVCEDDSLFDHLISVVKAHTAQWTSDEFRRLCAGNVNSENPFSFHYNSDEHYIGRFLKVYRRMQATVDVYLFDRLLSSGLLDSKHVIGELYESPKARTKGQYRFLPVYRIEGQSMSAYTVIRAQLPRDWKVPDFVSSVVTKDIRQEGLKTTIGAASFRECVSNKVDLGAVIKGTPGRRGVERTGKVGRPRKRPTVAQLKKLAQRFAGPKNKTAHAAALSEASNTVQDQESEEPDKTMTSPSPSPKKRYGTRGKGKRKCLAESDVEDVTEGASTGRGEAKRTRRS